MKKAAANRSSALLVGTASYTRGLPAMPQAAANLTDLAECLSDVVEPRRITQRVDPIGESLVLEPLSEMAAKELDLLVFYYAGHGVLDTGGRLCLALPDSLDNGRDARRSSLPVSSVLALLKNSRAEQCVVILDCCYSARVFDEPDAADLHLLAATSRTEKAEYDEQARNTAFTDEMVRVLGRGIPDGPQWIDLDLLARWMEFWLIDEDRPAPYQRSVNGSGDFVIGRNHSYQPEGALQERAREADRFGRAGHRREAAAMFARLVAEAPEQTLYRRALATHLAPAGDPAGAVQILEQVLAELLAVEGVSRKDDEIADVRRSLEFWKKNE